MSGRLKTLLFSVFTLTACTDSGGLLYAQHAEFDVTTVGQFDEPWALEFLPDGQLLVSEVGGAIKVLNADGDIGEIMGLPEVSHGGQGGFGDIVLHPDFGSNDLIYFSYAERGAGETSGAAVARAQVRETRSLARGQDDDFAIRQSRSCRVPGRTRDCARRGRIPPPSRADRQGGLRPFRHPAGPRLGL